MPAARCMWDAQFSRCSNARVGGSTLMDVMNQARQLQTVIRTIEEACGCACSLQCAEHHLVALKEVDHRHLPR